MKLQIRSATAEDAPAVAELLAALGYPATADQVRDRLGEADCVLITDGGLIALHRIPRLAEGSPLARITALVVTPERRGAHIGRALLGAAEEVARGWDCALLEVSCGRRAERAPAHAFYRATGFLDTRGRSVRYWKQLRDDPSHPTKET